MVKLTAGHSMASGNSRRVWAIVAIDIFWVNYDSSIMPPRLHRGIECRDLRFRQIRVNSGSLDAKADWAGPSRRARKIAGELWLGSGVRAAALTGRLPRPRLSVLQFAHEPGEPGIIARNPRSTTAGRSKPWPNPISPSITTFVDPSCTTLPCGGRKYARILTTKSPWI